MNRLVFIIGVSGRYRLELSYAQSHRRYRHGCRRVRHHHSGDSSVALGSAPRSGAREAGRAPVVSWKVRRCSASPPIFVTALIEHHPPLRVIEGPSTSSDQDTGQVDSPTHSRPCGQAARAPPETQCPPGPLRAPSPGHPVVLPHQRGGKGRAETWLVPTLSMRRNADTDAPPWLSPEETRAAHGPAVAVDAGVCLAGGRPGQIRANVAGSEDALSMLPPPYQG